MKYSVYGLVTGSKYMGEVEANSKEEALDKAWELDSAYISLCHHCSDEIDDPSVSKIDVEQCD